MDNLTFRIATMEDLPRLAEINGVGIPREIQEAQEKLPSWINDRRLICESVNENIVGLLYWREDFLRPDFWFLTMIHIDKDYQGKGYGEALWKYFLELAKSKNIAKVFCDIEDENSRSINLAKKMGAVECGSIDFGDKEPVKLYRIDL